MHQLLDAAYTTHGSHGVGIRNDTRAWHDPWELSAVVRYVEILNAMRHMKDHIPTRFTTIS